MKLDFGNLNLRQLRYFLEVAELHSFTRAAGTLHIAQSALSRQIRVLEDDLGVVLFNRVDRGVTLTEAGERLRDRATGLLKDLHRLRLEASGEPAEPQGDLSVGMPPSMRDMVTVPLMRDYCNSFEKVTLHVHEGISVDLSRLVQEGRLDCAVIVDMMAVPQVSSGPLMQERLYLIGPRAARLNVTRPVSLDEVAAKPLILTTRPNSLRLVVENALTSANLPITIIADSNSTASMVELAAEGMAYTVLPYCAAWKAIDEQRLSAAPISGLTIDWVFIQSQERNRSPAADQFRHVLYSHCSERIKSKRWRGAALSEQD
jgi:LysR family nitrogen assimilation transcriptional regulator